MIIMLLVYDAIEKRGNLMGLTMLSIEVSIYVHIYIINCTNYLIIY